MRIAVSNYAYLTFQFFALCVTLGTRFKIFFTVIYENHTGKHKKAYSFSLEISAPSALEVFLYFFSFVDLVRGCDRMALSSSAGYRYVHAV